MVFRKHFKYSVKLSRVDSKSEILYVSTNLKRHAAIRPRLMLIGSFAIKESLDDTLFQSNLPAVMNPRIAFKVGIQRLPGDLLTIEFLQQLGSYVEAATVVREVQHATGS